MSWAHISDALERLEQVTRTRRATGQPMTHDEFAMLERQRLIEWCATSPDHAEAVAWVADHFVFTVESVATIGFGEDEAQALIDEAFDTIRRALP